MLNQEDKEYRLNMTLINRRQKKLMKVIFIILKKSFQKRVMYKLLLIVLMLYFMQAIMQNARGQTNNVMKKLVTIITHLYMKLNNKQLL